MTDQPPAGAVLTGAAVLRGGLWNLASSFAPQLYLVLISVVAARVLGLAQFGRQSYIAFVEVSALMLFSAGLPAALSRYAAEATGRGRPDQVRALARWGWRLEAAGAALGGALVAGAGLAGAEPRAAWILAGVAVAANVLGRVPSAILGGLRRWRALSLTSLAVGALTASTTVAVLLAGGGIVGMFAVEAAGGTISLVATALIARRAQGRDGAQAPLNRELRSDVLRFAAVGSLGVALTYLVYRRTELFFLDRYSGDAEIGIYSIAFSVTAALMILPQALTGVLLPAVATMVGTDSWQRIRSGYGRALRLLVVLTLPVAAFAIALGPSALRLLYGEDFRASGTVLVILAAPLPLLAAAALSNVVLAGMAHLRFPAIAGVVAAGADIGLSVVLIPGHGAKGAAVANVAAQLVAGLPVLIYARRAIGAVELAPASLARAAAASAAAGACAYAVADTLDGAAGLAGGLVAGLAAFVAGSASLRILAAEDALWLEAAVGARMGGLPGRAVRALGPARTAAR